MYFFFFFVFCGPKIAIRTGYNFEKLRAVDVLSMEWLGFAQD